MLVFASSRSLLICRGSAIWNSGAAEDAADPMEADIQTLSRQEGARLLLVGGQSYEQVKSSILLPLPGHPPTVAGLTKHKIGALQPSARPHSSPNRNRVVDLIKSPGGRLNAPGTDNKPASPARSPSTIRQAALSPVRGPSFSARPIRSPARLPPLKLVFRLQLPQETPIQATLALRLDVSIVLNIFSRLSWSKASTEPPVKELLSMSRVCKTWGEAASLLLRKDVALTTPEKIQFVCLLQSNSIC